MSEYWFVRRFPVGSPRNALAPITREGYAVAIGFVAAMVIGAALFIYMTFQDQFVTGLILFLVISVAAGIAFVAIASKKADLTRTIDDYKRSTGPGTST